MGADTAQIQQKLYEEFLVAEESRIADEEARLRMVLQAGPTGNPDDHVLWVYDNNEVAWLRWCDVPRKISELKRVSQILYSWTVRGTSFPVEHLSTAQKFIAFVDAIVRRRSEVARMKERYNAAVTTLPAKAGSFPEHARRDRPRYALAAPSGPG